MGQCGVKRCCSRKSNEKTSRFVFPKDLERRKKWLRFCGLPADQVLKNHKICSVHFEPECFQARPDILKLKPDAVPTIIRPDKIIKRSDILKSVAYPTIRPAHFIKIEPPPSPTMFIIPDDYFYEVVKDMPIKIKTEKPEEMEQGHLMEEVELIQH